MKDTKQRNKAVEALRFLSILQICIWHMQWPLTEAGFLGVEFFFILSGMFLYKNAVKPDSPGVVVYTFRKLSKFWFKIIIALLLSYIVFYQVLLPQYKENWIHPILRFISESLLLQSSGSFEGSVNSPIWFFSALIYGGAIVYALTRYYTKISLRIIFPLISLAYFAFSFKNGSQMALEEWNVIGFLPISLVRGICEMAFGVVIGYVYFSYRIYFQRYRIALDVVSMISSGMYLLIIVSNRQFSQYALIFIPVIICAALTDKTILSKILKGEYWSSLGKLSFDIFIIHCPVMAVIRHFLYVEWGNPLWIAALVYYAAIIPSAMIFDKVVSRLSKYLFINVQAESK